MTTQQKTRAQETLEKVIALRWLARSTGMKTYKSENVLLNSLTPEELAEVSLGLMEHQENQGW